VSDERWGEAVKAVVEVAPGTTLTSEQVIDYVGSKIARYKRPARVAFTETLPKNAQGLIDRAAVKSAWGEGN
jgi:acyl-CoA synthetase (AMP-forming)/AMP-acid ligase II